MNLCLVVFCSFVLLPNLMCKLTHNQCNLTGKLIIKTTAACVYANKQSVLVVILCFTSEIILKQLFALNLVNIGECSPMFTLPSANNCLFITEYA